MTLLNEDLIREVFTNRWHAPVLRVLADGPARYVDIRRKLILAVGASPGDGYISRELRALSELRLITRRPGPTAHRPIWALTALGEAALASIDSLTKPQRQLDDNHVGGSHNGVSVTSTDPGAPDGAGSGSTGWRTSPVEDPIAERAIDTSVAHPARRYNYWLGGKDNFAADRASGDEIQRVFPGARLGAIANRAVLRRATRYLTSEQHTSVSSST